ncbi:MAG: sensor histidine kinase [Bacillota bacterium]
MDELKNNLEKFDLIWIIIILYIVINLLILLPFEKILYSLDIISSSAHLNFFIEFIMELSIVVICFNIFLISIYSYNIMKKTSRLFTAVGFLFAAISNLAHAIFISNQIFSYGSSSELFAIYNKLIVVLVLLVGLKFKKSEKKEKYYFWSVVCASLLFIISIFIVLIQLWDNFIVAANITNLVIIGILTFDILIYVKEYLITKEKTILILLKGLMFLFIAQMLYIDQVEVFGVGYHMAQSIKLIGFIYIFRSEFSKELKEGIDARNQLELKNTKLKLHQSRIKDLRAQRHDFKNELQTIFTMLQLGKADKARNYIQNLHLDLNDTDAGEVDHELSPVLISKRQEAKQDNIEFSTDIQVSLEEVIVPENKVLKVLFNLIDNAIDAIKEANVTEREINVKLIDDPDNVKLVVHNPQPIIPAETIDNIFAPGFSTKGDNRGFGLYIVKSLLADYGGNIEAESEKDLGTRFICYFPKSS